jgi:hypothetical protein
MAGGDVEPTDQSVFGSQQSRANFQWRSGGLGGPPIILGESDRLNPFAVPYAKQRAGMIDYEKRLSSLANSASSRRNTSVYRS